MRSLLTNGFAALVLVSAISPAVAQVDPRPYHEVAQAVENAVKGEYPSYTRTSIPPAQPAGSFVEFTEDVHN